MFEGMMEGNVVNEEEEDCKKKMETRHKGVDEARVKRTEHESGRSGSVKVCSMSDVFCEKI